MARFSLVAGERVSELIAPAREREKFTVGEATGEIIVKRVRR